jgi:hypothetical protein
MTVQDLVTEANDRAAALLKLGHGRAAETIWRRLLGLAGPTAPVLANLSGCLWAQARYEEAEQEARQALQIDQDSALAYGNLAQALEGLRRGEEALYFYSRAEALGWDATAIAWNRSLARLANGDYAQGLLEYEARFDRRADLYPKFESPRWAPGIDLTGKTVLCVAEQGIGDTILWSRFLPQLSKIVERVYFCVDPNVLSLLWSFRKYVSFLPVNVPIPKVDYHIFLGSLPLLLGCTLETIPEDPGLILERVKEQRTGAITLPPPTTTPNLKVGICWKGSPRQERDQHRSFPLETLLPLAENPKVWLYSLQLNGTGDIALLGAQDLICDLSPELERGGLPAAGSAMLQMDVVITCCTSIAHLAGSIGVPCNVLLGHSPYWVWGRTDTTPWYESVVLFRRGKGQGWGQLIKEICCELALMESRSVS